MDEVDIDRGRAGTIVKMKRVLRARRADEETSMSQLAEFDFEERGSVLVASINGEIDGSNASDLRLALADRLPSTASALVLDLSNTSYLDSAGIHTLFELGRRLAARRQSLRLVVPAGLADAPRARALRGRRDRADGRRARGVDARAGPAEPLAPNTAQRRLARRGAGPPTTRPRSGPSRVARRSSTSLPSRTTSATRFANACSSSISLRPIGRLGRGRRAITPSRRPPPTIGAAIRAPALATTGPGVVKQLGAALERRAAERALAERDDVGEFDAAVGAGGGRDPPQREPVLLGEVDATAIDVVERDEPVEHRRRARRRVGLAGRGGGGGGRRALGRRRARTLSALISLPFSASATACERVDAPSLVIAFRTCVRTVSGERTSSPAIWAPLRPSARQAENLAFALGQRNAAAAAGRRVPQLGSSP